MPGSSMCLLYDSWLVFEGSLNCCMAGLYARLARLFKSVLEACSLGVSEVFVLYGFRANAVTRAGSGYDMRGNRESISLIDCHHCGNGLGFLQGLRHFRLLSWRGGSLHR
eukprot:scaffold128573_cov15-Tisochrysis_lutea.AAC.1